MPTESSTRMKARAIESSPVDAPRCCAMREGAGQIFLQQECQPVPQIEFARSIARQSETRRFGQLGNLSAVRSVRPAVGVIKDYQMTARLEHARRLVKMWLRQA